MARLNLLLLLVALACALAVVDAQHRARSLFSDLERAQERVRTLDAEYGRLQLDGSAWSAHTRVDRIARERLGMRAPEQKAIQAVTLADRGVEIAPMLPVKNPAVRAGGAH